LNFHGLDVFLIADSLLEKALARVEIGSIVGERLLRALALRAGNRDVVEGSGCLDQQRVSRQHSLASCPF
jgi:hypothetical protein